MRLNRDLQLIFVSNLLWSFGTGLYLYLWPIYAQQLGATAVQLGLLFALAFALDMLVAIPGGWLADHVERRVVIVAGWWVAVPSALAWAWAQNWQQLIIGVVLFHVSNIVIPAFQAYVAQSAPPNRLASTMTVVFSAFSFGMLGSPLLGGWLASHHGMVAVFYVCFVFYAASAGVISFIRPLAAPERPAIRGWKQLVPGGSSAVWRVTLVMALIVGLNGLAWPFATPFLRDRLHFGLVEIGLIGSLSSLGGVLLSLGLAWLAERRDAWVALAVGQATLAAASLAMVAAAAWSGWAWIAMFSRGSADGSRSLMTSLVAHAVGPRSAGRAFALYNTLASLTATLAPYLGGWLYDRRPGLPFLVTVWALALLLALGASQRLRLSARASTMVPGGGAS